MTREEQQQYIESCLESQRKYLMDHLDKVPENWDGIELRNWFADVAVNGCRYKMERKRARDYQNDIIVHNL
jgi:hypothetical protein